MQIESAFNVLAFQIRKTFRLSSQGAELNSHSKPVVVVLMLGFSLSEQNLDVSFVAS